MSPSLKVELRHQRCHHPSVLRKQTSKTVRKSNPSSALSQNGFAVCAPQIGDLVMQMMAAQSRIQHDTCVDPACTTAREISIVLQHDTCVDHKRYHSADVCSPIVMAYTTSCHISLQSRSQRKEYARFKPYVLATIEGHGPRRRRESSTLRQQSNSRQLATSIVMRFTKAFTYRLVSNVSPGRFRNSDAKNLSQSILLVVVPSYNKVRDAVTTGSS